MADVENGSEQTSVEEGTESFFMSDEEWDALHEQKEQHEEEAVKDEFATGIDPFTDDELEDIPLFDDDDDDDEEEDADSFLLGSEDSEAKAAPAAKEPKKEKKPVQKPAAKAQEPVAESESPAPKQVQPAGENGEALGAFLLNVQKVIVHGTALSKRGIKAFAEASPKKKAIISSAAGVLLILSAISMFTGGSDETAPVPGNLQYQQETAFTPQAQYPPAQPPVQPPVQPLIQPTVVPEDYRVEPAPVVAEPVNPRKEYRAGIELFRDGKYQAAIEAFENDISSSYLFLARCYQILGENEAALSKYQRVLWEYPDRNAFVEVLSLAEELYSGGDYPAARKLFYAFIAQMDQMPGSVKKMVPRAYFKICRCLEEEAIGIHDLAGMGLPTESDAEMPVVLEGSLGRDLAREEESWTLSPPFKIQVDCNRDNEFLPLYTVKCVGAPGLAVVKALAGESGSNLKIDTATRARLADERVSAFLKDRPLEEVLEYVTGQIGLTYTLDKGSLSLAALEDQVQGDWQVMKDEALKAFRRSLYRFLGHDNAPKVYFEISRLHFLSGDYDAAINPAKTLIVEYPEHSQIPIALLNISTCYMELGDFGKAREFLSELVNKYTNHPSAQDGFIMLARCWWKEGNPAAAQLTLRSLEDRFPQSTVKYEGKVTLARIFSSLGKFGDVVKLLTPIPLEKIKLDETVMDILLLKAEAELRMGAADASIKSLVTLLETFPEGPKEEEALYLLAEAYFNLDQFIPCVGICQSLRESYESCSSDPFLYTLAGRALQKAGFQERTLEWLDSGLERCNEGTRETFVMYMLLGDTLFDMEKYQRAKVVYRKVWDNEEFRKEAQIKTVRAQMQQQDYRGALKDLRGIRNDLPGNDLDFESRIFTLAGDCYQAMGRTDAAIRAYEGYFWEDEEEPAVDDSQAMNNQENENAG